MKSWKNVVLSLPIFAWCGCAHLATVQTTEPRVPSIAASEDELILARQHLAVAERAKPLAALGDDLSAAKLSLGILEQRPNDSTAQSIYNFSVARAVENVGRAKIQPWQHKIDIVGALHGKSSTGLAHGATSQYTLTTPKPIDSEHDPSRYDLFPTDSLKIGGQFFKTRSFVEGVGAPLVAAGRAENPQFREHYALRRVYASVTAVVKFTGQRAELQFVDPLTTERITLGKHVVPLAADFTASTAMLMARERPERIGFARLIRPEAYANTARLFQLQQFDPTRTPVIFVHGLQDTPASWAPMINSLRSDPWIRRHYQFWVFSYPSGYPYPYSAMLLRRDLDGIARAFPNRKRIVLVGHSMGGMITRLMVTNAKDTIWRNLFGTAPARTPLTNETRDLLEKSLVFKNRSEVRRVVFISTPHRGSTLASSWIGRIGTSLVRTPQLFEPVYAEMKPLLVRDPAAGQFNRMPNSVDTLEPNDRFVRAVNKLPIAPGIPYHSIIGDRGRGDTPKSSDGVVPYWSSHVDGAQSELIVNSGHSALRNPEAIREVARILKKNLSDSTALPSER